MDRFHLINVFVAVADCQGLAGAARKLKLSPPAVTRAINELEAHLGLRLLMRTTRTVRVTEAGQRYLQDCRRILADFEPAALPVHVVHREGRQAPQRVRAFLDLAIERLRQNATLNQGGVSDSGSQRAAVRPASPGEQPRR